MEGQQHRGRSLSAGQQSNQRIRHSPSPHNFHSQTSPTGIPTTSTDFNSQPFNSNIAPSAGQYSNLSPPSFMSGSAQQPQFPQHVLPSNDFTDQNYRQSYQQNGLERGFQQESSHLNAHQGNQQFQSDALGINPNFEPFPTQPDFIGKQGESFGNEFMLDPQLNTNIQPQGHINPADIMSNVSSPQNMVPTPPNQLMPPEAHSSGPNSPISNQGHQWSPHHSRNASLDPSAAFTNGQQPSDWAGMQFQTHRRAPSEHSDVSSSVAPSPFLAQQDSFEQFDHNPSPMLNAQQDPQMFENGGLGIETFSLSESQDQRHSPRHSPFVSPRMSPQPGLGMAQDANFMPLPNNHFNGGPGSEIFTNQTEQFPQFPPDQRVPSNDMGQAAQMPPPEINVEFAPTARQPNFEPPYESEFDGLSPPARGKLLPYSKSRQLLIRNAVRRGRAKSDTYISRPTTPNSTTSTLGSTESAFDHHRRSLSPYDPSLSPNMSRESSPGPRTSPSRRSSTSSIPNRDYILELADPTRPPAAGTEKRVQKHPATFQCTLCPKKFTRAYNLRSHLRTHTDERPFVCTVCGKAFARQHDRKRHEGLHSGEKKFVCRGDLGTGGSWGCGRRFARADALGRHFRSEAGRVCIKPLLDEEAMERQRVYDEQMMNQNMQGGGMAPQPPMNGNVQNYFPAALLAQYPALQQLSWDQMGQGGDEGEISGRSSFDASSGGDYFDEAEEGGYVSGPGTAYANGNGWDQGGMDGRDWASDYEGR